jgi:hypothetical protein
MLGSIARAALVCALICVLAGAVFADDIVTMPTANELCAGQVDVAAYYIDIDSEALIPPLRPAGIESARVQTMSVGLFDWWELDAQRYDVDVAGADTIFVTYFRLQAETPKRPQVVIGARDITNEFGHASYFLCTAKTLNPPVGGPPTGPIYRLHVSLGTEDQTLFGESISDGEGRHEGLFGGLQVMIHPLYPQLGAIALWDGADFISGVTYTPDANWPTFKAGTLGEHFWIGANYTFNYGK